VKVEKMTLSQALGIFKDCVVGGTIDAPDAYPDWHPGYAYHRAQLLEHWSIVKSKVRIDMDEVDLIDQKLTAALESCDRGEREPGQGLMVQIYNTLNSKKLR
jgi:hypothetical protein